MTRSANRHFCICNSILVRFSNSKHVLGGGLKLFFFFWCLMVFVYISNYSYEYTSSIRIYYIYIYIYIYYFISYIIYYILYFIFYILYFIYSIYISHITDYRNISPRTLGKTTCSDEHLFFSERTESLKSAAGTQLVNSARCGRRC